MQQWKEMATVAPLGFAVRRSIARIDVNERLYDDALVKTSNRNVEKRNRFVGGAQTNMDAVTLRLQKSKQQLILNLTRFIPSLP